MAKRFSWLVPLLMAWVALAACDGTLGEHYNTVIDRVEPPVPGLGFFKDRTMWGEVIIQNNTGIEVYIYDQNGQEVYKVTAEESFYKDKQGNWIHERNGKDIVISRPDIQYEGSLAGLPKGKYRGQVMKEWVIEGRAGDTPFKIHGRTVYNPPPWDD